MYLSSVQRINYVNNLCKMRLYSIFSCESCYCGGALTLVPRCKRQIIFLQLVVQGRFYYNTVRALAVRWPCAFHHLQACVRDIDHTDQWAYDDRNVNKLHGDTLQRHSKRRAHSHNWLQAIATRTYSPRTRNTAKTNIPPHPGRMWRSKTQSAWTVVRWVTGSGHTFTWDAVNNATFCTRYNGSSLPRSSSCNVHMYVHICSCIFNYLHPRLCFNA